MISRRKLVLVFAVIMAIIVSSSYYIYTSNSNKGSGSTTISPPIPGTSLLVLEKNVTLTQKDNFLAKYYLTINLNIAGIEYIMSGNIHNATKVCTYTPSGPGAVSTAGPGDFHSFTCSLSTDNHTEGAYSIEFKSQGNDNFSLMAYAMPREEQ